MLEGDTEQGLGAVCSKRILTRVVVRRRATFACWNRYYLAVEVSFSSYNLIADPCLILAFGASLQL